MCNVTQTLALTDTMLGLFDPGTDDSAEAQYAGSLAALDYSQAQTRLNAQNAIADAAASRESYQRGAAQESGQARAGYGASGFSLDSGSILDLVGGKNAETLFNSANYTRQANQEAAKQRFAEEYYGQKKSLLYEEYERTRKNSTLLGSHNSLSGAFSPVLRLI